MTNDLCSDSPQTLALIDAVDILRGAGLDATLDIVDKDNMRIEVKLEAGRTPPYDTLLTSFKYAVEADHQSIIRSIAISTAQQRR